MTSGIIAVHRVKGHISGTVYEVVETEEYLDILDGVSTRSISTNYRDFNVRTHHGLQVWPVFSNSETPSILHFMVLDKATGWQERCDFFQEPS